MRTRISAAPRTTDSPGPGMLRDQGAVTVEAAIALSALTLTLALILGGAVAVIGQLSCADAARAAARLIARGAAAAR